MLLVCPPFAQSNKVSHTGCSELDGAKNLWVCAGFFCEENKKNTRRHLLPVFYFRYVYFFCVATDVRDAARADVEAKSIDTYPESYELLSANIP